MEEIKVLIADDELPVREELAAFPWAKYTCRIVGEARNGKEALQLCAELHPNMIITDLAMPIMNGIELAEKLRVYYPDIQIVFLTVLENFEYAQHAIQLNVIDYIVKFQMQESSIAKVLDKARNIMEKEDFLTKMSNRTKRQKLSKLFSYYFIEQKMNRSHMSELEQTMIEMSFLDSKKEFLFLIQDISGKYRQVIDSELLEYLEGCKFVDEWMELCPGIYVIKVLSERINSVTQALRDGIKSYFQSLIELPKAYFVVYPYTSRFHTFLEYINHIYGWYETHFYYSDKTTFRQQEILKTNAMTDEDLQAMSSIFSKLDLDRIDFEKAYCLYAKRHKLSVDQLKEVSIGLIKSYFKKNQKDYPEHLQIDKLEVYNIEQLASYIQNTCLIEVLYRPEVYRAIRIIREEYANPLTLTSVAEQVGLSPQYLSRVFREQAGENFVEYLTRIRIQKAKDLVLEGHHKVYEIADMVGMPNYRYFSTLFRKIVGVSPTQLRSGKSDEWKRKS
ncbi:response regulator [Blautia liquoris]|jgi:two-component system response regulator YesN|uniref:Stage 0 sporulation protein A homolog n=1 Tax=Blautia liquoris TaxID=2779518 RepID=A0A7M2RGD8_9FIRM|nr:response regulator [Blautia liquoris]QOV19395.1 response regulator [Blautia liquoris]